MSATPAQRRMNALPCPVPPPDDRAGAVDPDQRRNETGDDDDDAEDTEHRRSPSRCPVPTTRAARHAYVYEPAVTSMPTRIAAELLPPFSNFTICGCCNYGPRGIWYSTVRVTSLC